MVLKAHFALFFFLTVGVAQPCAADDRFEIREEDGTASFAEFGKRYFGPQSVFSISAVRFSIDYLNRTDPKTWTPMPQNRATQITALLAQMFDLEGVTEIDGRYRVSNQRIDRLGPWTLEEMEHAWNWMRARLHPDSIEEGAELTRQLRNPAFRKAFTRSLEVGLPMEKVLPLDNWAVSQLGLTPWSVIRTWAGSWLLQMGVLAGGAWAVIELFDGAPENRWNRIVTTSACAVMLGLINSVRVLILGADGVNFLQDFIREKRQGLEKLAMPKERATFVQVKPLTQKP